MQEIALKRIKIKMVNEHTLKRFIEAQQTHYPIALAEIKAGSNLQ